jgi:hypothetical protein
VSRTAADHTPLLQRQGAEWSSRPLFEPADPIGIIIMQQQAAAAAPHTNTNNTQPSAYL